MYENAVEQIANTGALAKSDAREAVDQVVQKMKDRAANKDEAEIWEYQNIDGTLSSAVDMGPEMARRETMMIVPQVDPTFPRSYIDMNDDQSDAVEIIVKTGAKAYKEKMLDLYGDGRRSNDAPYYNRPRIIQAWVATEFDEAIVEPVAESIIESASGGRNVKPFEQKALDYLFPNGERRSNEWYKENLFDKTDYFDA